MGRLGLVLVSVLIAAGLGSVGCAKKPEAIAPAYVSHVTYQNWTCRQLAEEHQRIALALATASEQQLNARTNDTLGVIFIGLPVSSMSGGNIAPQIARLKGEADAVRMASNAKHCNA